MTFAFHADNFCEGKQLTRHEALHFTITIASLKHVFTHASSCPILQKTNTSFINWIPCQNGIRSHNSFNDGRNLRFENSAHHLFLLSFQLVHLHFTGFDIEFTYDCSYDSVKIHDGAGPSAPLLDTYCGSDSPGDITSSGNTLFVSFSSDNSITKDGFNVIYKAKSVAKGK